MKFLIQKIAGVLFNERYITLSSTSHLKCNSNKEVKNGILDYYIHYILYKLYISKNLNRPKSCLYFASAIEINDVYAMYYTDGEIQIQKVSKLISNNPIQRS